MDAWVLLVAALLIAVTAMLACLAVDWLRNREEQRRARPNAAGVQELDVRVEGGYHPAVVVVEAGSPVRLNFVRAEDVPYSGRVIFGGLGLERHLSAFATTSIDFVPEEPGEYLFTCELGMYQGWLRVEPEPRRKASWPGARPELIDASVEPDQAPAQPAGGPGLPSTSSRMGAIDVRAGGVPRPAGRPGGIQPRE